MWSLQALVQAGMVQMQSAVSGGTPSIITPVLSDEPGATPMDDGTPDPQPLSTGVHLQRGGLRRALLAATVDPAARAAAHHIDMVRLLQCNYVHFTT